MPPIRILLAEPDPVIANTIYQTLEQSGMQVMHVSDGRSLFALLDKQRIDMLLVSMQLRDDHGFNICQRLRAEGKLHPIILLSDREQDRDPVVGIELGADDFLYLPVHPGELLARIFALLRRSKQTRVASQQTQEIRFGDIIIDLDRVRVIYKDELIDMTPTEFRLLRYLVEHPNQTCDREELMSYLRGSQSMDITPRTIDVHIRRLRQKLEETPASPRWLVTVHGIGYKFVN